ncbi:hypothetical protein JIN85_02150 [Luteolibacter pohnpeiensis]|uniref:Uncharacterized protein n=1 Tax=Luteolibacter pohnpeiensis TaxID=454153 RepID=A0A934VPN1_9BACT|nr:hypothetical protein [Luteolibacter pohnpeiensis]MBK1881196.1 hypothetical protein [Luteolibacter pohnpeiensis]
MGHWLRAARRGGAFIRPAELADMVPTTGFLGAGVEASPLRNGLHQGRGRSVCTAARERVIPVSLSPTGLHPHRENRTKPDGTWPAADIRGFGKYLLAGEATAICPFGKTGERIVTNLSMDLFKSSHTLPSQQPSLDYANRLFQAEISD